MPIRWVAMVGALALAGVPALTACSAATNHQAGATVSSQVTGTRPAGTLPAGTLPGGASLGPSLSAPSSPGSSSPGSQPVTPSTTPAISNSDLAQVDQQLADAFSLLGAVDQDASHNESGDSTP